MNIDEQLAYLTKGCVDVVRVAELRARLERFEKTGKPMIVKVGFDPTAPDLHLGHTVLIRKMKHFQDLGHTVVYVVGAFTALIGDPTGRSKTRPPLTPEEIARNAETYKTQIFKILDREKTVVAVQQRMAGAAWQLRLGQARGEVQRRADARAPGVQVSATRAASRSRSTSSSIRWRRPTTRCS